MLESLKQNVERFFSSTTFLTRIKSVFFSKNKFYHLTVLIIISYLAANLVSSLILPMLNKSYLQSNKLVFGGKSKKLSDFNYREIKNNVLERNIFNEKGEFPVEEEVLEEEKEVFNLDGPCMSSKLPYQLLGTLYDSESGRSLASIKEKKYDSADTYMVGDLIFGTEDVVVVAIFPNTVILNNSNKKECLYSSKDAVLKGKKGELPTTKVTDEKDKEIYNTGEVLLEAAWVEFELGAGFSKILQTGNITPNIVEGKVSGYIVTNPHRDSLFDKIGLKSMDIITQVNELTLDDKNDGFTLYSAFQNESVITLHVQRGAIKKVIEIEIK